MVILKTQWVIHVCKLACSDRSLNKLPDCRVFLAFLVLNFRRVDLRGHSRFLYQIFSTSQYVNTHSNHLMLTKP
jgi:hypothetical protein